MRVCKRGHVDRYRGYECLVCKKMRDDRYRENARVAGLDAPRQRAWYQARYRDPVFRAREHARMREYKQATHVRLARQLGVSVAVARDICSPALRTG